MKTKIIKEENKNFLNNQNYILGKTEKKKLLSKFFIENFFRKIINVFSLSNSLFYNKKYIYKWNDYMWSNREINVFFIVLIYIILFVFALLSWDFKDIFYMFIVFSPIFLIALYIVIKKFHFIVIKKYSDFFIVKWYSFFNYVLIMIFFIYVLKYLWINFGDFWWVIVIIWIFISAFLNNSINFFNILFIPFIILFLFLSFIFYSFYVFILRWIKWFKIIKYTSKSKILNKFKNIDQSYAENKYYKIAEK